MLAETMSATVLGVDGVAVRVEVDVAFGLPALTIVGLAGSSVQEARERVRSAVRNSGFELPARRVTVNLAPADLPKDGTAFDLAIAVGILVASGQLVVRVPAVLVAELALDGGLQPVAGAMALAAAAREAGAKDVIVAEGSAAEAGCVSGIAVHAARTLGDVVAHLAGRRVLAAVPATPPGSAAARTGGADLAEVAGQSLARRALEIALAGRHNLALSGPPGIGKSLILQCAGGLLPPLDDREAIDVSRIYSVAGLVDRRAPLVRTRPVRSPHHTISPQALVGGGPRVRPGEASLAHHGVLILDETLEFRSDALDALRQPMETGSVTISRVDGALTLPASFSLLMAFNPCPCGWRSSNRRLCRCDDATARRYAARLSGPLRDRVDLSVAMSDAGARLLVGDGAEPSSVVAPRIARAWQRQQQRQGTANGRLALGELRDAPAFAARLGVIAERRARQLGLSPRRLHRTLRVARTIADLEGEDEVGEGHLDEALLYRPESVA